MQSAAQGRLGRNRVNCHLKQVLHFAVSESSPHNWRVSGNDAGLLRPYYLLTLSINVCKSSAFGFVQVCSNHFYRHPLKFRGDRFGDKAARSDSKFPADRRTIFSQSNSSSNKQNLKRGGLMAGELGFSLPTRFSTCVVLEPHRHSTLLRNTFTKHKDKSNASLTPPAPIWLSQCLPFKESTAFKKSILVPKRWFR